MEKLIFDIGMHIGRDTEFYLKKGFNVVSIEANPTLAKKGLEKFKSEIQNNQLTIIDKAISDKNETIDFYVFENKDDWGTIIPNWNQGMDSNVKTIKVESVKLEDIIRQYGTPYYMKIDIEGADLLCLKSLLKVNDRPEFISVELLTPNNLEQKVDALDILCHLKALGYTKFKVSDQSKNKRIKCPIPALEGSYVDYAFDGETSGLFGKELQGEWYSIDEVAQNYLYFFYRQRFTKNTLFNKVMRRLDFLNYGKMFPSTGWFDIHATN